MTVIITLKPLCFHQQQVQNQYYSTIWQTNLDNCTKTMQKMLTSITISML